MAGASKAAHPRRPSPRRQSAIPQPPLSAKRRHRKTTLLKLTQQGRAPVLCWYASHPSLWHTARNPPARSDGQSSNAYVQSILCAVLRALVHKSKAIARAAAAAQRTVRTSAPSSSTTLPGGRPGVTKTMKTVNNSSETASPRGGVGSIVMRIRSTATKVNTIRLGTWTSWLVKGEVPLKAAPKASCQVTPRPGHGGCGGTFRVVGGSRSGKGSAREDGRPDGTDHRQRCPSGVRAAVGAGKPGNAGGAKGGRKADGTKP